MAAAMKMAKAENFMMEVWEEGKEAVYVGERAREREGERAARVCRSRCLNSTTEEVRAPPLAQGAAPPCRLRPTPPPVRLGRP